jgi:hypothetical protein
VQRRWIGLTFAGRDSMTGNRRELPRSRLARRRAAVPHRDQIRGRREVTRVLPDRVRAGLLRDRVRDCLALISRVRLAVLAVQEGRSTETAARRAPTVDAASSTPTRTPDPTTDPTRSARLSTQLCLNHTCRQDTRTPRTPTLRASPLANRIPFLTRSPDLEGSPHHKNKAWLSNGRSEKVTSHAFQLAIVLRCKAGLGEGNRVRAPETRRS